MARRDRSATRTRSATRAAGGGARGGGSPQNRGGARAGAHAGGETGTAQSYLPAERSYEALRSAAAKCRGCHLWERGTQTVFGEGSRRAALMLVGEQPGDREDREGHPFVGPAGRILDQALAAAGIERREAYVTNVVKHFKWEPRGKSRIHKKPNAKEIGACRPWLEAEIELVRPRVLVALGATAAQALYGSAYRVSRQHGEWVESGGVADVPYQTATVHPSSILRQATAEERERALAELVADLRKVQTALQRRPRSGGRSGG